MLVAGASRSRRPSRRRIRSERRRRWLLDDHQRRSPSGALRCGIPAGSGRRRSSERSRVSVTTAVLADPLDGVGDRGGGDHGVEIRVALQGLDCGVDQLRRDQRPGRVVDDDELRVATECRGRWQPTPSGSLRRRPARHPRRAKSPACPGGTAITIRSTAGTAGRRRPTSRTSAGHPPGPAPSGRPAPSLCPEPAATISAVLPAMAWAPPRARDHGGSGGCGCSYRCFEALFEQAVEVAPRLLLRPCPGRT